MANTLPILYNRKMGQIAVQAGVKAEKMPGRIRVTRLNETKQLWGLRVCWPFQGGFIEVSALEHRKRSLSGWPEESFSGAEPC
ncbi:MAG: hypothetical protein ACLTER_04670 [Ruminococcus sp.]